MKTYKLKSSAVRAAKKEFGDTYAEQVTIEPAGDEFQIVMMSLKASIAVVQQLADVAQADSDKAAKKAEIESRKPVHIPKAPITSIVASESIPTPKPSLPAFLKIAPPEEAPVAEFDHESAEAQAQADEMETSPDFAALNAAAADKLANAQVANSDSARPRMSVAEKPTKLVWHVADSMPGAKRKDVIEECVRRGIAYGTARTQYQHWFKCLNDSKSAPIATIGADGKITMPSK